MLRFSRVVIYARPIGRSRYIRRVVSTLLFTPLGLMQRVRTPFGLVTAPATFCRLMRNTKKVQWTPRCDQSLAEIKTLFSSPSILVIPDMQETFVVRSDASDFGIGAILLQDRGGTLMPCRYASRKLLPREGRYYAIEREALALVFAVTQCHR
ncbi:Pol polyprotein [Plakobranchus ocellatus]|uniref:Pol polyprotein n=1 Tax=Plakobranchus ocellatus TaxID=259542 RepID=A0AAV4CLR7_9GAST|nr:Pol polyprotein [Plakobranchus ocellatus]